MPVRPLPAHPDLDHLKYQARDLIKRHAARDLAAVQRIREFHPSFSGKADAEILNTSLKLSDAQLTIARESGFASWTRLRQHVLKPSISSNRTLPYHERIEHPALRRAVALLDAGDADGLQAHLEQHPGLMLEHAFFEGENYFRTPTLLQFIAENPIRHGKLPENILAITRVIIGAGVTRDALNETLGLVSTGRVARECVAQIPLINLLCDHGADSNGALRVAALHGEHEAVSTLLHRGATLDLPVAAVLGRIDECRQLLAGANSDDRHLALAGAARFGQVEIVRLLLDADEDPDRYNPLGAHSHSTPLHQAALAGHERVVRLLVERGARLDTRDTLWQGTPADWAHHEGRLELEAYLREQMAER